jgi:hypothetical protein
VALFPCLDLVSLPMSSLSHHSHFDTIDSLTHFLLSGGNGGATASCNTISVKLNVADITAGMYKTSEGFGLRDIPFYDANSGSELGIYSDFATALSASGSSNSTTTDCVATGAFSFVDSNQTVVSTINLAFTCQSSENAIVGGTGAYGCANGYEQFQSQDAKSLSTNLVVCGPLCKS